jgi:hypothetical protein
VVRLDQGSDEPGNFAVRRGERGDELARCDRRSSLLTEDVGHFGSCDQARHTENDEEREVE